MNNQNLLDALTLVGFVIGLANYDENVSQSQVQQLIDTALGDIHSHLQDQDLRLKSIENKLIEVLDNGKFRDI